MRSQPFELDGTRLPLEALGYTAESPQSFGITMVQKPEHAHLFSPTGFLDDAWWHRSYWVYGSHFFGGWSGYMRAGKFVPAGKVLVMDDQQVYGFGREMKYYKWTNPIEHMLYAASRDLAPLKMLPADRAEDEKTKHASTCGTRRYLCLPVGPWYPATTCVWQAPKLSWTRRSSPDNGIPPRPSSGSNGNPACLPARRAACFGS